MSVYQCGQHRSARQAVPHECTAGDPPRGCQGDGEMQGEVSGKVICHIQLTHLLTTKHTPIQMLEG